MHVVISSQDRLGKRAGFNARDDLLSREVEDCVEDLRPLPLVRLSDDKEHPGAVLDVA